MKNLVMFGYNMEMGGAERAMINVINVLKDKYNIDLILIKADGCLMKDIPDGICVKQIKKNIVQYIFFRFVPLFRKWTIRKMTSQKYDVAVAFMEGRAATWLTDMNQTCTKIGWIHNDVNKFDIGIKEKEIRKTYSQLDKIAIVSKQSKENFCEKYEIDKNKVEIIYNLIDEETIKQKAELEHPKKERFTFVSVAKMRLQKRHDRLLNAIAILSKEGYDFQVWLIGDGPLEEENKKLAMELGVLDKVQFMGLKENPFPYVKAADFFVMSSDHEGYPLSLLEALLLKTPVITTDVSGAKEILKNDKYGIICDVSLEGLVNAMRDVMDKNYSPDIETNLLNYSGINEEIEKKILELL